MAAASTQEQLVQILRVYGPLTAAELGRLLEIGTTAVHQHLDRLQAEGVVEVASLRRGRGRPKQVFAPTAQSDSFLAQHYDALALEILDAIGRLPKGLELLRRVLAAQREIWNERYGPVLANKTLQERLVLLTSLFNEKGYLAGCAAQPDGTFLLTKHHCTIGAVVARYPQFCQEEQTWLAEMLQTQVEALQSRAAGDLICTFRIVPQSGQTSVQKVGAAEKGA